MTENDDGFAWKIPVDGKLPDDLLRKVLEEGDADDLCGPDAELDAVLADVEGDAEELSNSLLSLALHLFGAAPQILEKGGDLFGVYGRTARMSEAASRILARAGISGSSWARARGVRGLSLRALGEMIDDRALSCRFIAHAVEAGEQAASANSEGVSATEWSKFRYELATALNLHALCQESGEKARPILERAIEFSESALGALDRREHPLEWVEAQICLVNALRDCSDLVEDEVERDMLVHAAEAQKAVLEELDPKRDAGEWISSQERLGEISKLLGEIDRSGKARRYFAESAKARKAALRMLPRDSMPMRRAMNQFRLAQAMAKQAAASSPDAARRLYADAAKACEAALPGYSREKFPDEWIEVNELLSMALSRLADGAKGKKGLRLNSRALEALEEAIRASEPDADPLELAMQRQIMAKILGDVAKCEPDSAVALSKGRRALEISEEAAKVFDSEGEAEERAMNRHIRCAIAVIMVTRTGSLEEGRELALEAQRYCDEGLRLCPPEMADLRTGLLGYQKVLRETLAEM